MPARQGQVQTEEASASRSPTLSLAHTLGRPEQPLQSGTGTSSGTDRFEPLSPRLLLAVVFGPGFHDDEVPRGARLLDTAVVDSPGVPSQPARMIYLVFWLAAV